MVYTRLSWILYQDFTRLQSKAQLGCTPFWCSGSFSKFTWFLAEFSSRQQWHLGLCFLVVYWLDAAPSSYRPLTVPYHVAALTGPPSTWQLTSSEPARQRLIPQSHISLQATLLKTAHTHTHTHTHVYMVRMTSYCFSYIQWVRSKKATGSAHTQGKGSHKKGSPSFIGGHLVEHLPNYAQHIDFNVKFKSQHSSLITKHWNLNKTELSIYVWWYSSPFVMFSLSFTHTSHHMCACMLNLLSCVQPFVTQWTVTWQAPLSMRFSRQEY